MHTHAYPHTYEHTCTQNNTTGMMSSTGLILSSVYVNGIPYSKTLRDKRQLCCSAKLLGTENFFFYFHHFLVSCYCSAGNTSVDRNSVTKIHSSQTESTRGRIFPGGTRHLKGYSDALRRGHGKGGQEPQKLLYCLCDLAMSASQVCLRVALGR